MRHFLDTIIFIFISASFFGQTKTSIIGKYSFIEQKGIHSVPAIQIGNNHVSSYVSQVDTTIHYSLYLDVKHHSVLQIDTTVGIFVGLKPIRQWHGKWERKEDTLIIKFDSLRFCPFFISDGKTKIQKLKSQIIIEFAINKYDKKIYSLELLNSESPILYTKE